MNADSQHAMAHRTATLSALQFETPNIVPKISVSMRLSGHGQTVSLIATLGRAASK